MRASDFDDVIELAAEAVEDGCPTTAVTKRPCPACVLAAARVRLLEMFDLPPEVEE
jgi:hypothetical protein